MLFLIGQVPASVHVHHNYIHLFMQTFRLAFNTRVVIPLWLPINTTNLGLWLSPRNRNEVCFYIEFTGCPSSEGKYILIFMGRYM